jgi:hypothetical protein
MGVDEGRGFRWLYTSGTKIGSTTTRPSMANSKRAFQESLPPGIAVEVSRWSSGPSMEGRGAARTIDIYLRGHSTLPAPGVTMGSALLTSGSWT